MIEVVKLQTNLSLKQFSSLVKTQGETRSRPQRQSYGGYDREREKKKMIYNCYADRLTRRQRPFRTRREVLSLAGLRKFIAKVWQQTGSTSVEIRHNWYVRYYGGHPGDGKVVRPNCHVTILLMPVCTSLL